MGPYASAAVFSFTKRIFVPAIDTNVRRVIGRIWLGIPYPTGRDDDRVMGILKPFGDADERGRGNPAPTRGLWTITFALMDFGSAVCTSKHPRCASCPLRNGCRSKKYFTQQEGAMNRAPTDDGRRTTRQKERIHEGKRLPDRIYRGRILALVRDIRRVNEKMIGPRVDETFDRARDAKWMRAIVDRLISDGFLARKNSIVFIART